MIVFISLSGWVILVTPAFTQLSMKSNTPRIEYRKLIREALTESGVAPHIDELVARLLDQSSANEDDAGHD